MAEKICSLKKRGSSNIRYFIAQSASPTLFNADNVIIFNSRPENAQPSMSINGVTLSPVETIKFGATTTKVYNVDHLHATDTCYIVGVCIAVWAE